MTQIDEQTGTSDRREQAESLEVRIARQLLDQAKPRACRWWGRAGYWPAR
jgi:hypothetical protein